MLRTRNYKWIGLCKLQRFHTAAAAGTVPLGKGPLLEFQHQNRPKHAIRRHSMTSRYVCVLLYAGTVPIWFGPFQHGTCGAYFNTTVKTSDYMTYRKLPSRWGLRNFLFTVSGLRPLLSSRSPGCPSEYIRSYVFGI